MRRTTQNVASIKEFREGLMARLHLLDTREIARILEVFATTERCERFLSVINARVDSVTVLMDAPHDPHNGAAVLRSSDAFGIQRVHIIERLEGFHAARTVSRGSERWVETRTYTCTEDAVAELAASGHELVATHPNGELTPERLATIPRFALVLGNERDGIHESLMRACTSSVRIPMRGFTESLNVSVTAAILLQQATHGRAGDLSDTERAWLYARALILSVPHAADILAAKGIFLVEDPSDPTPSENREGNKRK